MILLVIIVQQEDTARLTNRLVDQGFRLTQINATGGFLVSGSAMLLIGVEDERLSTVVDTVEACCHTRTRLMNATPMPSSMGVPYVPTVSPIEVLVGGAVVFGVPVQRFVRLLGGTAAPETDLSFSIASDGNAAGGKSAQLEKDAEMPIDSMMQPDAAAEHEQPATPSTNLVVAIMQSDDADRVIPPLLAAEYRLTRLNSSGGFFRRGNATLLIGVEPQQVEALLAIIQENCRPRATPNPIHQGMPMYGATIFVLNASHFLRF